MKHTTSITDVGIMMYRSGGLLDTMFMMTFNVK